MQLSNGNMFYHKSDYLFFTANNVVHTDGLVMGAGAAKGAKFMYPTLPLLLGKEIRLRSKAGFYGLVMCQQYDRIVGAFQTKYHWRQGSPMELLIRSTKLLEEFAYDNQDMSIFLNFPAIGCGGLTKEQVLPIIKQLPNNVTVWERR